MFKNHLRLVALILFLITFSISCIFTSSSFIEIPPETLAAMTWSAMESAAALLPTHTATAIPPTFTPTSTSTLPKVNYTNTSTYTPITPITAIPTGTPGPTATQTSILPTITASGGGGGGGGSGGSTIVPPPCNAALFIEHVTIPNETILPPSTAFTKIWRIKNVGRCTWTTDYKFVYSSGDKMDGANIFLSKKVSPGGKIDIEINMISPSADGAYIGYWYLKDDDGILFGHGKRLKDPFIVKIIVAANPQGTIFDFQKKYCSAEWAGDSRTLPCPGNLGSKYGFVVKYNKPILESGKVSDSALWTHPPLDKGSTIKGKFPAILIETGDRFRSEIGCLAGYSKCDVTFQLYYKEDNQKKQLIGHWQQVLDGSPKNLDIDLSSLAGRYVSFILAVTGNGKPEHNAAYWYHPEIYRP